jgi:hypothetical protein
VAVARHLRSLLLARLKLTVSFGNHLARDYLVLYVRVAICEAAALLPKLLYCHRDLASAGD